MTKARKPTTLADIETKWPIRHAIAVALNYCDPLNGTQCQMMHTYGLQIEQKLVPIVQARVRAWGHVMPPGAKCGWRGLAANWDDLGPQVGKAGSFTPKLGPDCPACKDLRLPAFPNGKLVRSVEWSPGCYICPDCEHRWRYR